MLLLQIILLTTREDYGIVANEINKVIIQMRTNIEDFKKIDSVQASDYLLLLLVLFSPIIKKLPRRFSASFNPSLLEYASGSNNE
jgi:hypothetical protein